MGWSRDRGAISGATEFLLFLKADELSRPPFNKPSKVPKDYD